MSMRHYRFSDQALEDLEDIWLHIATDDINAADRFVDTLIAKIETLATQPTMGRARDELRESLRSFPVGNYLIFYRPIDGGVEVVRVLSGFRDLPELFLPE